MPNAHHLPMLTALRHGLAMVQRRWRAMALYTIIVAACGSVVLTPMTTWVLHHLAGYGDVIVGNYNIHLWMFTPRGLIYLLLAGSVVLFMIALHATGLLQIARSPYTDRLSSIQVLRRLLLLWRSLLRLSVGAFIVCIPFALLIAAGPGLAKFLLLTEYDINYYIVHQPPQWYVAIVFSVIWLFATVCLTLYVFIRWFYALPAWLDGERPLRRSLPVSWRATRGRFWPLFRMLAVYSVTWLCLGLLADFVLFRFSLFLLAQLTDSLEGMVHVIAGYIIAAGILRGVVIVLGMAWGACLWMIYYRHDVPAAAEAEAPQIETNALSPLAAARSVLRFRIVISVIAVLLISSWGLSAWFFSQGVPDKLPQIIAHRAGAAHAPENTIAGLKKVLKDKAADIVEIDVTITRDGELVVAHDADLMKQAKDPRLIRETDYDDIKDVDIGTWFHKTFKGENLEVLDNFLKRTKGRMPMIVEFKHGKDTNLVERTIEAIRACEMEDEIIIMSLELGELRKVQELAPEIRVGYFASVEVGDLTELNVYCLGAKDWMVSPAFVKKVQEQGMLIYSWTVDDPIRMVELIVVGVDGIITNDPVLAEKVIQRVRKLPPPMRLLLRFRRFWGFFDELGWWGKKKY